MSLVMTPEANPAHVSLARSVHNYENENWIAIKFGSKFTNDLLHSVKLEDGLDRTEDFLLGNPHFVFNPGEDGRLEDSHSNCH